MSTQFSTQVKIKILVLLAVMLGGVGSFLLPSQPASASHDSEGAWANAVSACAIDDSLGRKYAIDSHSVRHKSAALGVIAIRCNVENLPLVTPGIGEAAYLQMTFRDQDGPGSAYAVIAQLKQLTNTGKVITLATVNSSAGDAIPAFQTRSTHFEHHFDFRRNAYFVEIVIYRTDTAKFPAAASVRLFNSL